MAKTGYTSIAEAEGEKASQLGDDGPPRSNRRSSLALVGSFITACMLLLFAVLAMSRNKPGASLSPMNEEVTMEGASTTRACSFEECYDTKCNAATAPYTCLFHNGGPHGGCSATPWYLETCDDQCNLSKCDDLAIPDSVKSCKGVECGKVWCAGQQVCPKDVSFQCTGGSARFGCSTDALQWTLKTDGSTCSSCCDTTTCV